MIFLDPQNTAIDFSGGVVGADGSICVEVEEERESLEQDTERQCTQQNVTQCYNTYVTKYTDSIREKCEEVFIKTCRIIMRSRAYNHTTRLCKRPLLKQCNKYEAPVSRDKLIYMTCLLLHSFLPTERTVPLLRMVTVPLLSMAMVLLMCQHQHRSLTLCVKMYMRQSVTPPHR